jgi:4-amino-4-deoxy-L-arabinose transferase-like glycosyltransferase
MARKALLRVGCGLLLVLVLFVLWYHRAANYDYSAVSGTYTFNRDSEKCTLHLRPNQTFSEELDRGGMVQKAEGQWRRYGEAHVSFSSEFLTVSGQRVNAAGGADGQFDKKLGLLTYLTLAPLPAGPTFHKKWFR